MGRRKVNKEDSLNKKTTRKNVNKVKKNSKIKRFFALFLFWLIILLILLGIGFGGYYIYTSDNLKVKTVKVENCEYYSSDQITKAVNVPTNKNMLLIGRRKIKNKILEEFPYIEDVKIKIGKEGTLRIILKERKSVYAISNKDTGNYLRVDKYGIMLEKIKAEDVLKDELPLFGLSLGKDEKIGEMIPETEYKKIGRFETIYQAYKNSKIEPKVTSVKFENSKIILTLDYKMEVITEPVKNLEYKMNFLREILKEVSGRSGTVDLTLDNPTFVEKLGK